MRRTILIVATILILLIASVGCSSGPPPTPTATPIPVTKYTQEQVIDQTKAATEKEIADLGSWSAEWDGPRSIWVVRATVRDAATFALRFYTWEFNDSSGEVVEIK